MMAGLQGIDLRSAVFVGGGSDERRSSKRSTRASTHGVVWLLPREAHA